MAKKDDSILMYRIAKAYYLQGVSQVEIAQMEGVSRSTVSRLLDKARSNGIVSVEIKLPATARVEKTGSLLAKKLGLKEVIVVPSGAAEDELTVLKDVASVAAAHMPRLLADCHRVGIGWGRSVYHTAAELPEVSDGENRLFVPMVNNFSSHERYLQTSSMVSRFCEQFGADGYFLNISTHDRIKGQRTEEDLKNIRQLVVYWDALDAAVLSFSSPEQLASNPIYQCMWQNGLDEAIVGDSRMRFESMGQVYYEDGSYFGMNRKYDMVALDLQRLKEIRSVICVAAGRAKADTLLYAARGGFYKTLVVDQPTAEIMLETLRLHRGK